MPVEIQKSISDDPRQFISQKSTEKSTLSDLGPSAHSCVIAITSRDHHRSMTFVPKGYELRIRTRRRSEKSLIGSVVYFLGRKRDSGVDSLV